ncbi:MAG: hypothetical protein ACLP5V_03185 [Candidatus Bathyarchaeia archaeon]
MTSEADHEVAEERSYPLTRLTSTVVALAKDSELHCSDVAIPADKSSDNLRASLTRILKTIVEAFGRSASNEYYFLTDYSEATKDRSEE